MQDIQTLSLFSHSHDIACMLQTTLSYSLSENSRTYQRQLLQRFLVYIQFFAVPTKQECGLIFSQVEFLEDVAWLSRGRQLGKLIGSITTIIVQ